MRYYLRTSTLHFETEYFGKKTARSFVWKVAAPRRIILITYLLTYLLTYLHTYLLTYLLHGAKSFGEANRFAASQEIPRILWNPKVHYRISQVPDTCPYPESEQTSSCPHIPLHEDPS
jgi:hypothetical protein